MKDISVEDYSSNQQLNSATTDLCEEESIKVSSSVSSISLDLSDQKIEEKKTLQIMSDINELADLL
jgi:hypothetical protein|tara:strand:+ start:484 stop:681 length:198 start_codon:yes stop_codon:yes gene_type:complete